MYRNIEEVTNTFLKNSFCFLTISKDSEILSRMLWLEL